jgi:hypothetical protein
MSLRRIARFVLFFPYALVVGHYRLCRGYARDCHVCISDDNNNKSPDDYSYPNKRSLTSSASVLMKSTGICSATMFFIISVVGMVVVLEREHVLLRYM